MLHVLVGLRVGFGIGLVAILIAVLWQAAERLSAQRRNPTPADDPAPGERYRADGSRRPTVGAKSSDPRYS